MTDASLPDGLTSLPDDLQLLLDEGVEAWSSGEFSRAGAVLERALAHAEHIGSRWGVIQAKHFLGNLAFNECRDDDSWRFHSDVLAEGEALSFPWAVGTSAGSLAFVDVVYGRFDEATANFERGIAAYEQAGRSESAAQLRALQDRLVVQRIPIGSLIPRLCETPSDNSP